MAAIPGSGEVPVAFTYSLDLARLVAASLAIGKWKSETVIYGEELSFNQFVQTFESVKGTKMKVTYDSVEDLKAGKVTELPTHPAMYPFFPKEMLQGLLATFGLLFESGAFDLEANDHSIVQKFPEVKPRTMRNLLEEAMQ